MKTYTTKELVSIIKKSDRTIRRYIQRGELLASRIGKSYVVSEEFLKEFFHNNQVYVAEDDDTDKKRLDD